MPPYFIMCSILLIEKSVVKSIIARLMPRKKPPIIERQIMARLLGSKVFRDIIRSRPPSILMGKERATVKLRSKETD